MVGIDTNVLIRYIVQDDAGQSALAQELIEKGCSPQNPASILLIVLCETVWVLSVTYGYAREQVASVLRQILLTESFDVEGHAIAWNSLYDYQSGLADYADCLIARLNQVRSSRTTFTFDRKAARLSGFTLLAGMH
jgi:predicted nucleic-acid-binding protein